MYKENAVDLISPRAVHFKVFNILFVNIYASPVLSIFPLITPNYMISVAFFSFYQQPQFSAMCTHCH